MIIRHSCDPRIWKLAQQIKLLVLDVDGVLTDAHVYYGEQGELAKAFYVRDGLGIKFLFEKGVEVAVISGRQSAGTRVRLLELGIKYIYLGIEDKVTCFEQLQQQLQLKDQQVAYMGDDLPDLAMIERVALGIAVADAVEEIKVTAEYITKLKGGWGAVREVCDLICQAQS